MPVPDLRIDELSRSVTQADFSDLSLREYLGKLMSVASSSYRTLVDANFQSLTEVFNVNAQFPFSAIVLTDRVFVRYALSPVASLDEAQIVTKVVGSELEIGNRDSQFQLDGEPFDRRVRNILEQLRKSRPPLHPVDDIIPIENFFTPTPMNDLVKKWLAAEVREIFGF
ncbi:MAG: hypothetical protein HYR71_02155 [Chloroflexi bacterium]|nr:hypothetical protein [Chloroflexota bacterium]